MTNPGASFALRRNPALQMAVFFTEFLKGVNGEGA
ncbi:hypothetical protein BH18ACT6_BH18ACT6_19560 [soil metagenome]